MQALLLKRRVKANYGYFTVHVLILDRHPICKGGPYSHQYTQRRVVVVR